MERSASNNVWLRLMGIPAVAVMLVFLSNDLSPENVYSKIIKYIIYVALYWEIHRVIFIYVQNRYPYLQDTRKRVYIQIIVFALVILVVSFFLALINPYFPSGGAGSQDTFLMEYQSFVVKSLLLLGLITVIYECIYFFGLYEKSMLEAERLKKENLMSQFELLKNQISPHFLFNSLNVLMTLVPENPDLSVMHIQKLSNVYRYVLSQHEKNVINLTTELQFLKDYIFLYQMRFGENLQIKYNLPDQWDHIQVIPLTLQMLVENALKHNIVSKRKPLTITISTIAGFIMVTNNLQRKTSGVESTNIGLQNIMNRYMLLTSKLVEVHVTKTHFSVMLPLIFDHDNL
ncbi:sensor histidine kinase [Dyadobacter helix]|nr:histidine kinase [Dyadobacter sp. CECT 9275]